MAGRYSDGFSEVSAAVACLWVVQALVILNACIAGTPERALAHFTPAAILFIRVIGVLGTLALYSWLIIKIAAGRNWARITFLVLFALSLPFYIPAIMAVLTHPHLSTIVIVLQLVLSLFAAVTMFTAPGRYWFARA